MKKCLIEFSDESAGLGDLIAMMPYIDRFSKSFNFEVTVMVRNINNTEIFKESFPEIEFIATNQKIDFDKKIFLRHDKYNSPLQHIFAEQLGFKNLEYIKPKVDKIISERPIKNKYVTFSMQSTLQLKYWNAPGGNKQNLFSPYWDELCKLLRKSGLTPVCVDYYDNFGVVPFRNHSPKSAVRKHGLNLKETINYISHSEFFIGLSSGLSWLAHALDKPVCMISNFTEDWHEFDINSENYMRITNKNVCHGCWNKVNIEFSSSNPEWYWCPRHQNTDRQFECHTSITPEFVFEQLKKWIN
jgi:autotransporter strand-loop-strand O-heptosyltransferase